MTFLKYKCLKCEERVLSRFAALAYSMTDNLRCPKCGANYRVSRVKRFSLYILESTVVVALLLVGLSEMRVWPVWLAGLTWLIIRLAFGPFTFSLDSRLPGLSTRRERPCKKKPPIINGGNDA